MRNAPAATTMKRLAQALCVLLIASAAPAWADIGRDDAAAAAQRATGGRVLSVEKTTQADRRPVWRVKVVTPQGEVQVILIDAASGQILR